MKYCPECGNLLEVELDYEKGIFNNDITLIKKCKQCKTIIDTAKITAK